MLANVDRLSSRTRRRPWRRFLDAGGGVLVAPGDRVDPAAYAALPWMPATLGDRTGDFAARKAVAHPAARDVRRAGPAAVRAGASRPPLAEADLFAYRRLEPAPGASVVGPARHRRALGRRAARRARAACCCWPGRSTPRGAPCRSTPTSSRSSTSGPSTWPAAPSPASVRPGEPIVFDLAPRARAGRHDPAGARPPGARPAAPR